MPFTSTATPEVEMGRGTLEALCICGESWDPNTLRIDPGAKLGLKLAPLNTPLIAGMATEPDPDAVTFTVTAALLVPLYVAVMVPVPNGNPEPFTASVAVAVPADPVKAAVPIETSSTENETDPDAVVPSAEVIVAIR